MKIVVALLFAAVLASCKLTPHVDVACGELTGLPSGNLLLVGEMHGSLESPGVAGVIACHRANHGPTALGLEIPISEQSAINAYLGSDGNFAAKQGLLAGAFWQRSRDGRSSKAMFDLIEYARQLKEDGSSLSVFAFDPQTDAHSDRDTLLARAIRSYHVGHPNESIVALMGNGHARRTSSRRNEKDIISTGKILEDLAPVAIRLDHPSGSIWACMQFCGIHEIGSRQVSGEPTEFVRVSPESGYDFAYVLPSLTASPPAVESKGDGKKLAEADRHAAQ